MLLRRMYNKGRCDHPIQRHSNSTDHPNDKIRPSPLAHVLSVRRRRAARAAVIPISCRMAFISIPSQTQIGVYKWLVHTMDIANGTDIFRARHPPPVVTPVLIAQQIAVFGTFAVEDCFAAPVDFGEGGVREEADVDFGVFSVEAGGFVGDVAVAEGGLAGGWLRIRNEGKGMMLTYTLTVLS